MSGINKKVYGRLCQNYEWTQKYKCGCVKDISISAMEKGSYQRAKKIRDHQKGEDCSKCILKKVTSDMKNRW